MPEKKLLVAFHQTGKFSSSDSHLSEPGNLTEEEEEEEDGQDETDEQLVTVISRSGNRRTRTGTQLGLRRVAPTIPAQATPFHVERVLPNGDLYTGSFLGNAPHGSGKYLWSDGCMYEGEWRRGKANGKGRFSWPSGATFEGEFKAGRMDGFGVFTGADGDTYKGMWSADKKHGHGEKRYANGDVYEGSWKNNLQDGEEGKYVWSNGSVYVGEWSCGLISGKGVLIWANGNRFEGYWENGDPKGNGVFTKKSDGTSISKNWGNGSAEGFNNNSNGGDSGNGEKRRGSIDAAGRRSLSDRGVNFPKICIWEDDEEGGDITCDIVDNVQVSKLYRDAKESKVSNKIQWSGGRAMSPVHFHSRSPSPVPYWSSYGGGGDVVKKPGQVISKGHKNYELMLNLQLGIRYSVGKHASKVRDLKSSDFEPREKYWTRFPPQGSKSTPPHQSVDFRWKDYCPMVFRHLRELFGIDQAEYMLAICGSDALREFSSPGKSGCSFYLTQDDRFMIKTVKKSEVKVLIGMLPSYYKHIRKYKNTLVTKFFGVHCVKPIGGLKTRFVAMGNLFHSDYRIHRRFDLKGSSHGRSIDKPEMEIDETTTLKDLDLNFIFRLQQSWFQELISQVDRDCEFLEAERIMDYSLLIGVHFRDDLSGEVALSGTGTEAESPDGTWMMNGQRPFVRLGVNMPARAEHRVGLSQPNDSVRSGSAAPPRYAVGGISPSPSISLSAIPQTRITGGSGEVFNVILYFGIIDILQGYDISKRIEHAYKSWQVDPTSISAVDPKLYSKRFRDFMHKIFVENE